MSSLRKVSLAVTAIVVAFVWSTTAVRVGGLVVVIPFVAPTAVFAIAVGWLAYAFAGVRFPALSAFWSAMVGGLVASPVVAQIYTDSPQSAKSTFVMTALLLAASAAIGGSIWHIGQSSRGAIREWRHNRGLERNKRHLAGVIVALCGIVFIPLAAQAQEPVRSDLLIRVDGPINVGVADTVGTLWVIGNDAIILGTVRTLMVMNGAARIDGSIKGNVVLLNSTAHLGASARVDKDVLVYRSTITSSNGAKIMGAVHNEPGVSFGARALWFLWLSVTIAIVVAGLVLGYFAGPRLQSAAESVSGEWRGTLLTALVIVCGLPAAAIVSFMTGIGFVLGLFIFFVLIPFMSIIGYLVASTALGRAMFGMRAEDRSRSYTVIAGGIVAMQVAAIMPGLGGLIVLVSSQLGAGAVVYEAWRRGRSVRSAPELVMQPA